MTSRDAATANQSLKNNLTLVEAQDIQKNQQKTQDDIRAAGILGSIGAQEIGDLAAKKGWVEGSAEKVMLHGLLGAGLAVIGGGSAGTGFITGAANELAVGAMGDFLDKGGIKRGTPEFNEMMKTGSALLGTVVGKAAGGSATDVALSGQTAKVATENNYLKHQEINKRVAAQKACDGGDEAGCATRNSLNQLDSKRQADLGACVGVPTIACDKTRAEANEAMRGLDLYSQNLLDKVSNGELTAAQAKPYIDQAQREKKDITSPLAADAYVRSGGNADPSNPAWVEYKALSATEGNDAAMALGMGGTGGRYEGQHAGKLPAVGGTKSSSGETTQPLSPNAQTELNARRDDGQQYEQYRNPDSITPGGEWNWQKQAPNGGAVPGTNEKVVLQPGVEVDRFGNPTGGYLAPTGTPLGQRSMPPGALAEPYTQYVVSKPFEVEKSVIAPAFDQPGLGVQYRVTMPDGSKRPVNVEYLVDNGYLTKK
jgi:Tuberculosis necrotizing toxin/Pre-toxin domain with VENN motif